MKPDADLIADLFAGWAQQEGILPEITRAQCADLAKAFMAGYAAALAQQRMREAAPERVDGCAVCTGNEET